MARGEPMYVAIARDLREKISQGELRPGDQIPTEKALMEEYGVSVTAVRSAIQQLRGEGLIVSRQGKGSFVSEQKEIFRTAARYRRNGMAPNLAEEKDGGWVNEVRAEHSEIPATKDIAQRLQIQVDEMVSQAIYRWRVDGELVQISTQWEPLSITGNTPIRRPAGAEVGAPDVITRFDSIGFRVTLVDEETRARMPTPEEIQLLRLPEGVPVLRIRRTHFSGETPVETANIVIRADRLVLKNVQEVQ